MRVFQRVTFADSALLSGETLSDTLGGGKVVGLQLSGTGTVDDAQKAKELTDILLKNASYLKAGTSETDTTLILVTDSGLSMQMFVSGDRLMACGSWDCPEFFEAFNKMLEE